MKIKTNCLDYRSDSGGGMMKKQFKGAGYLEFQQLLKGWAGRDIAALQAVSLAVGRLVAKSIVSAEHAREKIELNAEVRGYHKLYDRKLISDCIECSLKSGQYSQAANDNERSQEDDTIDAETLLGMEFAELSYVIPRYVVEGLTVLGGKPKLGKSWWAYDAGIAVATGGMAMGSVQCEQGDVIYLALEDNRRRVQARIKTLCPLFRKKRGIDLSRLSVRTVAPAIDKGLFGELDKWRLGCKNPRLIIIDVYMKVRPQRQRGEDVYAADYAAVVPLQKYASEHRLAIVLVTHTRKMEAEDPLESISGTNGVTGAADAVLVLTRGKSGATLYGRGRDIEEIETAMSFEAGRWTVLGDAGEIRKSDERRKIIAVLKESGELSPKAIADLTGLKAANVRVLLRKMVASGDINQPRVGFYSVPYPRPEQAA
jgi:hypothetical protein